MILVGNKCDNHTNPVKSFYEKANHVSQNVLKCLHFETSAKDDTNVKECFSKIFELISEQVDEAAKREASEIDNIKRRNSSMSFVRASSNKTINARRFSEPVVTSNIETNKLSSRQLDTKIENNNKKQRNCLIS
jgi:GTPase SAR1 family protein